MIRQGHAETTKHACVLSSDLLPRYNLASLIYPCVKALLPLSLKKKKNILRSLIPLQLQHTAGYSHKDNCLRALKTLWHNKIKQKALIMSLDLKQKAKNNTLSPVGKPFKAKKEKSLEAFP